MRRAASCLALAIGLLIGCDDSSNGASPGVNDAGGPLVEAGGPAPDSGTTGDGGALAPCLDRPGSLERPPSGRLPCDLLPPGFGR